MGEERRVGEMRETRSSHHSPVLISIRAVPEEFTIINAMPYTKMGKVDFKLLEKGYPENIEFEKKLTKTRKR